MNTDLSHNRQGNDAIAALPDCTRLRRRRALSNSGTSLVEILIVIVVILLGIFAIIQIFPIGFNTLRKSESALRADRMARNITEGLTADSSSLPESITFSYYPTTTPAGATSLPLTVVDDDPDSLKTYGTTAAAIAVNKWYFSDVNKYRYIKNEPINVPLPSAAGSTVGAGYGSAFGSGVGSVHVLTFGPIYMDSTVGDPTWAPTDAASQSESDTYLKVTSQPLTAISYDSVDRSTSSASGYQLVDPAVAAASLRGVNSYLIDYGDDAGGNAAPVILFAPYTAARSFTITYSYQGVSGNVAQDVVTPVSHTFTIPANTLAWTPLLDETNPGVVLPIGKPVVSGTDVVVRNFDRLGSGTAWDSTNPYQYKLVTANTASTVANLGVIAFNPAGANNSVTSASGTTPFTALASYAVLDWHLLHDDREVPVGDSNGVGRVRTTLPGIRVRGDSITDLTQTGANRNQYYPGLYPQQAIYTSLGSLPSATISPDIQVYNLSDSSGVPKLLTAGDLANSTTTDATAGYWINRSGRGGTYPTGTIYINTAVVPAGSKVRILYKAVGNWAVSFQKAASAYHQNTAANATRPVILANTDYGDPESFAIAPGTPAANGNAQSKFANDKIYFQRSELNKGMTAVIEYDTANGTVRLPARQFTVNNVGAGVDSRYAYVNVTDIAPELTSTSINATAWRIYGTITGVSLKTRVIWQDDENGSNPWRVSDLETYVTQSQQTQ